VVDSIQGIEYKIVEGINNELNRNNKSPFRKFTNQDFINDVFQNKKSMANTTENKQPQLNQILFGPPGTGKTFNTINEALKIVDPTYFETHQKDRKKLTDRFKELLIKDSDENKGQIAFCTFHQSFSYEDFVEGIKPIPTENKAVYYDIEDGVFKNICKRADIYNSVIKVKNEGKISWSDEQFKKASFYKLSLGNYQDPSDRHIYEYCRDHNYIAIGFGQENDFSGLSESEIVEKCQDLKLEVTAAQQMNYFIHYLKKNNYVIISNGNKFIRAIGKVIGDYEYLAESPIRYNHFRKVEWLFVDELIPIEEIYDRGLSQKTMYKIDESALKRDFFTNNGQETLNEVKDEAKNYVLVIDEINRGNVSAIFGELITLIEKDKRAGCEEELEVTLPYSKEPFKVPNNVYIIGTMNTADRSIEALDTALRRRFSFKEFAPKPYLIKSEGASSKVSGLVNGIDLEYLLNTINTRIEKLIDKDHKIGHSYFLKVDSKDKLVHAFKNEIIPLLEEYFFGDYGKIGLVLGSSFVEKINHDFDFADFTAYDTDIQEDLKEKAVFRIKDENEWNFSKI
jgi:5-methylcytosine-specific restriction protein B